ncbi:MAG: PAS domain S-box protein [Limisphaerales bacterium]
MIDFFHKLFSPDGFMPHGHCYFWNPDILWLHIFSDALIALAYYSIPFTLVYFIRKRRDLPFNWIFFCFAAFIILCGTTHLFEIYVIWHPVYWLQGWVKAVTALMSVTTAILLVNLMPTALALPSRSALQLEVAERQKTEAILRESEERFRRAFDDAPIGMALVNVDGRWLSVNPAICAMIGYSEGELLKTNFQSITHPEDLETDLALMRQLLAGEIRDYKMEKRYLQKDAQIMHALLTVSLVRDAEKRPLYFVAQILNITADKQRAIEREKLIADLQKALADVKTLSGLLPICAGCKSIRDDHGYWNRIETYIKQHSNASFTHAFCPECAVKEFEKAGLQVPPDIRAAQEEWRRKHGSL